MTLKEKLELIKGVKLVVKREKEFEVVFFLWAERKQKVQRRFRVQLVFVFWFFRTWLHSKWKK